MVVHLFLNNNKALDFLPINSIKNGGITNLRDKHGSSFVNNGTHRLRTSMSVMGAKTNLWNTPIAGHASTTGHKYSVAVRLDEQPSLTTPAGRYTDELYINLLF
ncbi:hypothetical protein [Acinetobacter sp. AL9]|uniref:hypothetical protein n=1 Tax=Acinetobacter sp. AL9 TaxID=3273234 RepID=UPI003557C14F